MKDLFIVDDSDIDKVKHLIRKEQKCCIISGVRWNDTKNIRQLAADLGLDGQASIIGSYRLDIESGRSFADLKPAIDLMDNLSNVYEVIIMFSRELKENFAKSMSSLPQSDYNLWKL